MQDQQETDSFASPVHSHAPIETGGTATQAAEQATAAAKESPTAEGPGLASLEAAPESRPLLRLLLSLPPDVLQRILRAAAGRRCRRVCRALLAAYGPLDCGLRAVDHPNHRPCAELQQMLQCSGQRLQGVPSLQAVTQEYDPMPGLAACIAQALPRLRCLRLGCPLRGADLALLGPLAPTLTALDVVLLDAETMDPLPLQQLSHLTALRLTGRYTALGWHPAFNMLPDWRQALGSLPQLVELTWFDGPWAQWVSGLAQLTSLSVTVGASKDDANRWDEASRAAVSDDLSRLKSLSVKIRTPYDPGHGASVQVMLQDLADCSRIEAVHVDAHDITQHLRQLSSLQSLASLSVRCDYGGTGWLQPPVDISQPQPSLTRLDVLGQCLPPQHLHSWLPTSLVELTIRGHWSPPCLLPHLRTLPALQQLALDDPGTREPSSYWTPEAAEQLSTLTQLTTVTLQAKYTPPPQFVRNMSSLTALRELRVLVGIEAPAGWMPDLPPDAVSNMTDADLLHLAALSQHLTHLDLGYLVDVSASGVVALLGALTSLQQLQLARGWLSRKSMHWDGEELVRGLLPLLAHLTCLRCLRVQLPQPSRDVLLAAAAAHDCRCELEGCVQ